MSALKAENDRLSDEVRAMEEKVKVLVEEKESLFKELQENRERMANQEAELQRKINSLEEMTNSHKRDAEKWMSAVACYEKTYAQCSAGLAQAITFLQGVNADIPLPPMDYTSHISG